MNLQKCRTGCGLQHAHMSALLFRGIQCFGGSRRFLCLSFLKLWGMLPHADMSQYLACSDTACRSCCVVSFGSNRCR